MDVSNSELLLPVSDKITTICTVWQYDWMTVGRLDTLDTLNNLRVSWERSFRPAGPYPPVSGRYRPNSLSQETVKLLRVAKVSNLSTVIQSYSHTVQMVVILSDTGTTTLASAQSCIDCAATLVRYSDSSICLASPRLLILAVPLGVWLGSLYCC